jgi:Zn-finger nucleic acid-binding protein
VTAERLLCPSCGNELVARAERFACERCTGVLVPATEVETMLRAMAPDDARTLDEWLRAGGSDAPRACPRCATKMEVCLLEGVTVDRCAAHGIWFDADELSRALERGGNDFAGRQWDPRELDNAGYSIIGTPTIWTVIYKWWTRPKRPKDL